MKKCRAIKKNGERCTYLAKLGHGGFCGHHFPREAIQDRKADIAATIGKWLAIANGLATLAKFIAHVFKGLNLAQTPPPLLDADSLIRRASALSQHSVAAEAAQLRDEVLALEDQFNVWFSRLPVDVQLAVYEWLDDQEGISEVDRAALEGRIRAALVGTL